MKDDALRLTATDVTVCPLMQLSDRQFEMATRMLIGDMSCSLQNLKYSCFASERCNRAHATSTGSLDARNLAHTPSVANDGGGARAVIGPHTGDAVLGVANTLPIDECTFLKLNNAPPRRGVLICNLCVEESYRARGVGRLLLDHIRSNCNRHGVDTYVSIALPDPAADAGIRAFMTERSADLVRYYRRMGFAGVENANPLYHVMRHRCML